jgi:hypothetical protein
MVFNFVVIFCYVITNFFFVLWNYLFENADWKSSHDFLRCHRSIFSSVHPSLDVVKMIKFTSRCHGQFAWFPFLSLVNFSSVHPSLDVVKLLKCTSRCHWNSFQDQWQLKIAASGFLKVPYVKEASKNFLSRKYQFNFESLRKIACFRKHDSVWGSRGRGRPLSSSCGTCFGGHA